MYWTSKTDTVYKIVVQDSTLKVDLKDAKKKNEDLMKQLAAKEEELKKIKFNKLALKKIVHITYG
jgi:hypothetical protein